MVVSKKFILDVEEVLTQSFKKEVIIKELSKSIAECLYKQFETEFKVIKDEAFELRKEFEEFKKVTMYNEQQYQKKLIYLEQRTRDKNVAIFGMKEKNEENLVAEIIDLINSKLGVKLNQQDIEMCRRFGKLTENKPRPIVVNFFNQKTKMDIFKMKKKLKGTGVTIKEDLIKENQNLYKEATEKYGFKHTWTKNGIIWVRTAHKTVRYDTELNDEPIEEETDAIEVETIEEHINL